MTKNEIQVFENTDFGNVRIVEHNGEPYFIGKEVAEILGYQNASKAVSMHVDDEDKAFIMMDIADSQNGNVLSGKTKTAIINESGLYSLILSSKLQKAKEFKHWVTAEVLPSIRKTGKYSARKEPSEAARWEIAAYGARLAAELARREKEGKPA